MQRPTVAILGASGYSGVELTRLVAQHPGMELAVCGSDRWAGESAGSRTGVATAVRYTEPDRAVELAASCAIVFTATPAEVSHELVPRLVGRGPIVIDLSGAFRLRDASAYARHYGFAHGHVELVREAVYGLPELHRTAITGAKLVANPGCYATAIQLALAPLRGLVTGRFVVDAVSGVTGAGRKATEELSFAEVTGDVRAYRTLRHQHAPEIEQGLDAAVTFVPHLVPIARGILATCHAELAAGVTPAQVAAAFEARYAREPFVELAAGADAVAIHDVVGTNRCKLGWTIEGTAIVVIAAIDNLVKGAAGQAVQNANLVLGQPETTGLALRGFHP
jgi:N-acetyl-gamma-glutamyl-phosphate reductase